MKLTQPGTIGGNDMQFLNGVFRMAAFVALTLLFTLIVDPLERAFKLCMRHAVIKRYALPRVIKHFQSRPDHRGHASSLAGGGAPRFAFAIAAIVLLFASMLTGAFHVAGAMYAGGKMLAIGAAATARDLPTILTELKAIQEKTRGRAMTKDEADTFRTLAKEGEQMQEEADRDKQIKAFEQFADDVPETHLPPDAERKGGAPSLIKGIDEETVGFMSLGRGFVSSPEYKRLRDLGFPLGALGGTTFEGATMLRGVKGATPGFVPVSRKQYRELLEKVQSKAIPTINTGVIRSTRDPEIVRAAGAEFDKLAIRDLLNVSQTESNLVDYVTFDSFTRAAGMTAENAAKPEATMAMSDASAPVRTLAVWMPVTEQQLMDVPQIENIIDSELRYDLGKKEEEELVWGRGTGQELLGIMKTPGVPAGRTVGGDTLLDQIRRAVTDIAVNGRVQATGVAIHPIDWEGVQLLKDDNHNYIWVVVTDSTGVSRIWSLSVVETIAMTDVLDAVNTTKQRVVLVGDFRRGATLWDRMQPTVAVGYQNDDFVKNKRTIRAEERLAFGVKRPKAFAYIETVAAAA
jgi:HK97 family phage major capsid protein